MILVKDAKDPTHLPIHDTQQAHVLMVRRKDSMSFMEFIRGKYDMSNPDYIHRLIANMSQDEQRKIVESSFSSLWAHLWGNARDTHSPEFYDAKEKFDALDRARIVYDHRSPWSEPEWGFPKGRRMRGETDMDCAMREFMEETNIPREVYTVCNNLSFSEVFTGTNNVQYKHVYFLCMLNDSTKVDIFQRFTPSQRREISAMRWMTLEECRDVIRPHYTRRKEILEEVERALSTFETLGNNQ
jgi:8-oxo-dGTP pyrophosphatase MutT (NUDIX family)